MKNKYRIFYFVSALCFCSYLSGCGDSTPKTELSSNTTTIIIESTVQTEITSVLETTATTVAITDSLTSDSTSATITSENINSPIKIAQHSLTKSHDGKDVLIIEYEFTNNTDKAKSFSALFTDKVFQNGVECSNALLIDDVDTSAQLANVLPNNTTTVKVAYTLQDMTKATVNVKKWISDDVYLNEEIDLGGGEGLKADTSNLSETSISIAQFRMSKDYKDQNVLIVDYSYYNGDKKAKSFSTSFSSKVYQNGVECNDMVFGCDDLDTSSNLNDIQPGVTITVSKGYILNDDSDVRVIVEGLFNDKPFIDEIHSLK